ncbi:hypothetical protein CBR_g46791 [Chara braunii]|uniref:DUF659 domain-containing protein n=1 Tax=Chara braunii TaxID=69332 RepID=A0A388M0X5_CHABU|nr:hypothetical protein CBR_g46791 [Chara braunii]|eukprot:GBG88224.1 hypothetical protein CBR_g46791 [Chara braunii]
MRIEGIRLGKHQANQLLGATGGSCGPITGPSSSSFVPPSSPRQRPSDGETPSSAVFGTCFPPPPGSGGRSLRQTLIEEADNIITQNEQTTRKMDRWLICTNPPFSMVENFYFLEFLDAVKKCHPSWWPCKRDETEWCFGSPSPWRGGRRAYFKLLDGLIQEIGAGSIVGVVMDNARVCTKAGKMVEAKHPGIFSVGCTTHALDLALEDMYKCMDWLKAVVDKGNQVGKFFTNVDKVRTTQLKRPTATRFATNFEMLQSLKTGKNPLELFVCNTTWVEKLVRGEQVAAFNAVTHIIMGTNGFWKEVDKAMAVMEPLVKLLQAEKVDVEKILMDRWAFMTSELHCAAAFLDPEYRTHTLRDTEIREGFNIWLYCWASSELLQRNISRQVDMWVQELGTLGTQNARDQRGDREDIHIPWKDDELARVEVDEWYDQWASQVREGTSDDAAAAEVCVDELEDAPLERTWLQNEEENFADDEDDIVALGALESTWHANTKPGKHRVRELRRKSGVEEPDPEFVYTLEGRDRALKARQTGDWVQGREAISGRGRRKKKATVPHVAKEQPVHKRKRKVGEGDAPPKKKRGRPPLSPSKKAAKAAARAEAAKAAAVEATRPAKRRTAEVIEDDEENPCRNRKTQPSSSSSSSSEDSAPQNIEEEEMSQQSDGSGEPDGDESEEDPSQAESHGEERSREEDE